jgi:peptide deformylase
MIEELNILDEKNLKVLKQKSKEVTFPLSEEDLTTINNMIMYLRISQDEEYAEEHNLRAGMGLAAIQLGIPKRYFVISYKNDDGTFEEYKVINPKIISHSEELIYVEEGEGCLSVNRYVEGIVPRYARITVEFYDENGNKVQKRVREEIAIAFQHEIDHLEGLLFTDKIDPKNPFKNQDNMRAI